MIDSLPLGIEITFILCCAISISLFHYANGKKIKVTILIILWSIIQSLLSYQGFYHVTDSMPPRFALVLLPATLMIIIGIMKRIRQDQLIDIRLQISTFLHTVRLPVEIVLYVLYNYKMIPQLMTFEGRNFDIIMGVTAPFIGWFLIKGQINKTMLLIWNFIGLFFVLFILVNGILSAELPFQQFGFEQPNRGINYFPFILLPATVVPIVIWTHISDILYLIKTYHEKSKDDRFL